ncbi:MAG: alginate O-acetyltransferase AlgX-related protein [Bacteroidia bacterium]
MSVFAIQKKTELIPVRPLDGIKELSSKPDLSIKRILDGSFQEETNTYLNDYVGFRPFLVRLLNEIKFRLFYVTKAPGVVIGKNGQFFIESYINNYIGINFVGKNKADENIRKIKVLQDSLKKFNTDLVIIFAPGKASYYSEDIPDRYLERKKDTTNYSYYSRGFVNAGVNFIDFNQYYPKYKYELIYPIYPEYGTHWTNYGSALAIDSIIRYIENKRGIDLPEFYYNSVTMSDELKEREYDIGVLLNLFRPLPHEPMPYVNYRYGPGTGKTKPNVLAVGDSYWWCMVGDNIPSNIFKTDEYWFYNRDIYKNNVKQDKGVNGVNFPDETVNREVILLMATEATFDLFPYGFVDKAYTVYCLNNEQKRKLIMDNINSDEQWKKNIMAKAKENKISGSEQVERDVNYLLDIDYTPYREADIALGAVLKEYEERIKGNAEWMAQVNKNAVENRRSVEEQLRIDAAYAYNMDYGSMEVRRALRDIRHRIKGTKEWMEQIRKKAAEKKITTEEMLELDVKFTYDEDHKKNG